MTPNGYYFTSKDIKTGNLFGTSGCDGMEPDHPAWNIKEAKKAMRECQRAINRGPNAGKYEFELKSHTVLYVQPLDQERSRPKACKR